MESPHILPGSLHAGFSGIRDRYRRHRGGVVRFLDPLGAGIVSVPTPVHYDAWLTRFLDPRVKQLAVPLEPLIAVIRGQIVMAQPHLQWRADDAAVVVEAINTAPAGTRSHGVAADRLRQVAAAHQLRCVVRSAADVRLNPILLCNLDYARQCMCLEPPPRRRAVEMRVCERLKAYGAQSRAEILAALSALGWQALPQCMDSVLFDLHHRGLIHIELENVRYGNDSLVCSR